MNEWDLRRLDARQLAGLANSIAKDKHRSAQFLTVDEAKKAPREVAKSKSANRKDLGLAVFHHVGAVDDGLASLTLSLRSWRSKPSSSIERLSTLIVFISNEGVEISAGSRQVFEKSLMDQIEQLDLSDVRAEIWDVSDVNAAVAMKRSFLRPYFESLSSLSYLDEIAGFFNSRMLAVARAMAVHSASELLNKQWIRTGDAGYSDGSKLRLDKIATDLPCQLNGRSSRLRALAIDAILEIGDQSHRSARGVVLVGGPGQGKSTIAQLIAHSYRLAILEGAGSDLISEKAGGIREPLSRRLADSGIRQPRRRRWPFVISLTDLAAQGGLNGVTSILSLLSSDLTATSGLDVSEQLIEWLRSWPICLILDGLDEVPDESARTKIFALISGFIATCTAHGVDLLLVTTTRPYGYQGEIESMIESDQIKLLELTETEALAYSDEVNRIRNADDPELSGRVTTRLIDAVHQRVTQRLMTTPLQVTIMTALAERAVDLPTSRYQLFDEYYKTIYDRELAKGKQYLSLRKHRSHIDHLHERCGLALHIRSESANTATELLSRSEVSNILVARLTTAGYDEGEAKSISDEILVLSVERLVMLVLPRTGYYGFEVRSLQEYMTARALTEGDDDDVLRRLEILLPSAYWRNTWLLAAGRVAATRERLLPRLGSMTTNANNLDSTGLVLVGSDAALSLLLDEFAADFPAIRATLLSCALELCADYEQEFSAPLRQLLDEAALDDYSENILIDRLESISKKSSSNLASLYFELNRGGTSYLAQRGREVMAGRSWTRPVARPQNDLRVRLSTMLRQEAKLTDEVAELANLLSGEIPGSVLPSSGGALQPEVAAALSSAEIREALLSVAATHSDSDPDALQEAISMLRARSKTWPRAGELAAQTKDIGPDT